MPTVPLTFNHHGMTFNHRYLSFERPDPNPLNLPPFTIRLKYKPGTEPSPVRASSVLVDATENIWDVTRNDTSWNELLIDNTNLLEVMGANSDGVKLMTRMFLGCSSLISVAFF